MTAYKDYVEMCLRFYSRYPKPIYKSVVDKLNWEACEIAFNELSGSDRDLLREVFSRRDTVADNVYQIAKETDINQNYIWKIVKSVERRVALLRNLI